MITKAYWECLATAVDDSSSDLVSFLLGEELFSKLVAHLAQSARVTHVIFCFYSCSNSSVY